MTNLARVGIAMSLVVASATARADGDADRAALRARSAALEGKIGRLTITVADPAGTPGLVVLRDGIAVPPVQWGIAVPLDPGRHTISVQAPGRYAWQSTVAVNAGEAATVAVPVLPPLPAAYEGPPRARRERLRPPRGERYNTGMMVGGIVLAASSPIIGLIAGVVAEESGARGEAPVAVGLTTFLVLAGAGIPLAVIGGRRVSAEQREEEARVRFVLGPHGVWATGRF